MAPILYCSCTNCSCSATVLLTQVVDMEGEGSRVEEVTGDTNRNSNCEENPTRNNFLIQNKEEESQTWELVEKLIFLTLVALLLFGKEISQK